MNKKTINILIILILLAVLLGTILTFEKLPEQIPIHWNSKGEVNSYGSKNMVWILYSIIVLINILMIVVKKIDPKSENYKKFQKSFDIFRLVLTLFFSVILVVTISISLGNESLKIGTIVPSIIGILLTIIGNYMPKFRHNYTMGIKTPWTLANEDVWDKTHRMASTIWVIGGIVLAISPFVLKQLNATIFILTIILLVLLPVIYSYIEFKKIKRKTN